MQALIAFLFPLCMYVGGSLLLGVAVYPTLRLVVWLWQWGEGWDLPVRLLLPAWGLGLGYFTFILSLAAACGLAHRLLGADLRAGSYAFFSLTGLRWVFASSLYMLVKYLAADFLVCTPWFNAYYRVMGARVGRGVMINSKFVHDHSLLEIGDETIIGGDAVISCHAAEKGRLVLKPVRIGKKCLIGQKSILMPGVVVEDGAVIAAQAVVLKDTVVPAGTTWGGLPARQIRP